MQCGIDPRQSSVSSCSFTCRRSSSTLFGNLSTPTLVRPSQVWFELSRKSRHNLEQYPTFPPFSPVTIDQVLNYKSCNYSTTAPLGVYRTIPRYVLGAALLILAVIPTLRQSVEMYKLTKRWHTDRSMKLLVREGAAYFIVYVLLCSRSVHRSLSQPLSPLSPLSRNPTQKN
jgi:hypothetical protein